MHRREPLAPCGSLGLLGNPNGANILGQHFLILVTACGALAEIMGKETERERERESEGKRERVRQHKINS